MHITIRMADAGDAEWIGAVHWRAWMETYTGLLPAAFLAARSAEKSAANFRKTGCRNIAVAEAAGEIVGFCGWGPFREESVDGMGEIQGIYLLRAFQRRGTGRRLLEKALQSLREEGFRKAGLWVLDTNRNAIAFYEKCGFSDSGVRKEAHLGAPVTEILYTKEIGE